MRRVVAEGVGYFPERTHFPSVDHDRARELCLESVEAQSNAWTYSMKRRVDARWFGAVVMALLERRVGG